MFREVDAECYILVDGDDTYPAESAPEMIRRVLENHADMVVGDRLSSTYFSENKRPFHNFGNSFVKKCVNTLFKSDIKDIMTGYRAFSYEFVKTFPVLSEGFEIETEMSIHAIEKRLQIDNVIIDYRDRPEGSESKLNTYSDGIKVLKTGFRMVRDYRPLLYFSILAAIITVVAIVLFIPVMIDYLETGLVERFPTLIVSGFLEIAALEAFFSGLMLSHMIRKNRQDFEFQYQMASNEKKRMFEVEYEK